MEVSHSDIGWLGTDNDLKIDADNIAKALDMMKNNTDFAWQHEDMVIMMAFLNHYENRTDELI